MQVFLVRKAMGKDAGRLYAMKVLKKATLKGEKLETSFNASLCKWRGEGWPNYRLLALT